MNVKGLNAILLVALAAITSCSRSRSARDEPSKATKEVVEEYCEKTAEGRWLGPERWDELQDFLADVGAWSPPVFISVVSSYKVGEPRRDIGAAGTVDYQVEVDYFDWGSINSFLNFARARGPRGAAPAAGEPVERRTYQTLYLTDRFLSRRPSGEEEKTGTLRWKIALSSPPSVDVDAAQRWVAGMRDKTTDPAVKYNAERTLATLRSISAGTPVPAETAKESASDVARRFVRLETGLLPVQWSELSHFFVETPQPQWNKAHIVDVVGVGVDTNGDLSDVSISTNSLGELDSSLRLSRYPLMRLPPDSPSASACYGDDHFGFSLLLSDKQWEIAPGGAVKQLDSPLAWRIEDTFFEPLITLDTAIRYITQVRAKTTDPVVKTNAARTLTVLEYYKKGKPLPGELSSGAGGGCG